MIAAGGGLDLLDDQGREEADRFAAQYTALRRKEGRSAAYYAESGFPELAAHYHPIDVGALRGALAGAGFEVLRLEAGIAWHWWKGLGRLRRSSFLVAKLVPAA